MKILLFLFVILLGFLVVGGILINRIRKFLFGDFNPSNQNFQSSQKRQKDKDVLYDKDDVVVMKGEADKNSKK